MPRYRRSIVPGGTFFFTVVTEGRQAVLTQPDVRDALREAIMRVREHAPFRIDGWVLMPDHLHAIWTLPPDDADFADRWRRVKAYVTRQCGERYRQPKRLTRYRKGKGQGTFWQHRFWEHQIRDERDFRRHLDYVHANPVKHRYVQRAGDWPWSTFHRYVREGVYTPDWCAEVGALDECWE